MAPFSGHMPTFDSMLRFAAGSRHETARRLMRGFAAEMSKACSGRELSPDGPVYLGIGRVCRRNFERACANVE